MDSALHRENSKLERRIQTYSDLKRWPLILLVALGACGRTGYEGVGTDELATAVDARVDATESEDDANSSLGQCRLALSTLTSCAYRVGGSVSCVGRGQEGQLGIGEAVFAATPVSVPSLQGLSQLTGAAWAFCANLDGQGVCWGRNENEHLQPGNASNLLSPAEPFPSTKEVLHSALGTTHGCHLYGDGKVGCWGENDIGQLGVENGQSYEAVAVEVALEGVTSLETGYAGTCALLEDGKVNCWGFVPPRTIRTPIDMGLSNIVKLSAHGHTFVALDEDSVVWGWGGNSDGQLGVNPDENTGGIRFSETPIVLPFEDAIDVAAGARHVCGITLPGEAFCIGNNSLHQLGVGTSPESSLAPVQVQGVPNAKAIAAGQEFSCVIADADESIHCWGDASSGQLGSGSGGSQIPTVVASNLECPPF